MQLTFAMQFVLVEISSMKLVFIIFNEVVLCFTIKVADAVCVEIATAMKKCSRLKDMPDFNVLWNFQPIWTCFSSIVLEIRNQLSSLVIPNKSMLPFWNLQKLTAFFRTAKSTLARSLKFPKISLIWFLYGCKCNVETWSGSEDNYKNGRQLGWLQTRLATYSFLPVVRKL